MLSEFPEYTLDQTLKLFVAWSQLHPNQVLGIMTDRYEKAIRIQGLFIMLLDEIPDWYLKCRATHVTKQRIDFENGSTVLFMNSPLHCKGRTLTSLAFDSSATFDDEALMYMIPSVSTTAKSLTRFTE